MTDIQDIQKKAQQVADMVVGMSEKAALRIADTMDLRLRVLTRDDKHYVVTRDLRADRVNVRIANGEIYEAKVG